MLIHGVARHVQQLIAKQHNQIMRRIALYINTYVAFIRHLGLSIRIAKATSNEQTKKRKPYLNDILSIHCLTICKSAVFLAVLTMIS